MKKGMSFTLTVVVVGVILMTTALTIITLGGASLGDFFNTVTGTGEQEVEDQRVQDACKQVARRIQSRYCDGYYNESSGAVILTRSEPEATQTCNERNCDVGISGDEFSWDNPNRGNDFDTVDLVVTVDGDEYRCGDYGLSPACPMQ